MTRLSLMIKVLNLMIIAGLAYGNGLNNQHQVLGPVRSIRNCTMPCIQVTKYTYNKCFLDCTCDYLTSYRINTCTNPVKYSGDAHVNNKMVFPEFGKYSTRSGRYVWLRGDCKYRNQAYCGWFVPLTPEEACSLSISTTLKVLTSTFRSQVPSLCS